MKHRCTVCEKTYDKGADEILNGCVCGNTRFYFVNEKKTVLKQQDNNFYELEDDENNEIIAFDLETINIIAPGKYEIDVNALMTNDELVYKYGEGKYSVDIEKNLDKKRKS
jgi:uncharacterized protein